MRSQEPEHEQHEADATCGQGHQSSQLLIAACIGAALARVNGTRLEGQMVNILLNSMVDERSHGFVEMEALNELNEGHDPVLGETKLE